MIFGVEVARSRKKLCERVRDWKENGEDREVARKVKQRILKLCTTQ